MSADKENFFNQQMQKFDEKASSYMSSPLKNSFKRMSMASKKTPPEKYKQLKVNKKDHLDGQNNMTYEEQLSCSDRDGTNLNTDDSHVP